MGPIRRVASKSLRYYEGQEPRDGSCREEEVCDETTPGCQGWQQENSFCKLYRDAKMLHRQPKHLLAFLFAELGTSGAIDGSNQLIMKGRFQQKHIENVLRRYIKEYVTCHTCRSPDTILNKETRLFFLQCMTCHSSCSVQTIKTGFQAVTGKRSAIRAKTT